METLLIDCQIMKMVIICKPTIRAECSSNPPSFEKFLNSVLIYFLNNRGKLWSWLLTEEIELAFANDGVCLYWGVREIEARITLIFPIMLERRGICLRTPHQTRWHVSRGLWIYFPCSSHPAGKGGCTGKADEWKEMLFWLRLESEERRNQTEKVHV